LSRYIISYDLRKPSYTERDYQELYAALGDINAKHIQDSVWAASLSDWTAEQIFDYLWKHMHQSKDRLLVVGTSSDFKNINGITKFKDV
jgi:CRISPR/Cas system-associated endoribonuclease Cas2